ncbi:MAG: hypothetical protein HY865_13440 [Chloroflexi bacterium]|nr:hypothetical protein [Chloroflexota bacterium]
MRDTYIGTREGSLQSVTLTEGFTFITIPMCLRNLADTKRAITFSDIYVVTSADEHIPPMGQAYRQSEAFGWLVPILWRFGGLRVSDEFWYTPIQSFEMLPLDANASIGCTDTKQFKNFAYLFMLPSQQALEPFTLHFFEKEIQLLARTPNYVPSANLRAVKRLAGYFCIVMIVLFFVVRRRKKLKTTIPSSGSGQ